MTAPSDNSDLKSAEPLPGLAAFVRGVDRVNDFVGRSAAWLTAAMVVITFLVVLLRYGFAVGWVSMQESYVWLHGVVFMVGAAYTLLHRGHVRVDVIYRPAGPRFKAWVDLFGSFLLLLPTVSAVAWVTWPYVLQSWLRLEESREAGGLPGLFLLKTVILVFCFLMALQALALAGRSLLVLVGHREFVKAQEEPEGGL